MSSYHCSDCLRELGHGERVIVWAPMEILGEPEDGSLFCSACESKMAARVDQLIGAEESAADLAGSAVEPDPAELDAQPSWAERHRGFASNVAPRRRVR